MVLLDRCVRAERAMPGGLATFSREKLHAVGSIKPM